MPGVVYSEDMDPDGVDCVPAMSWRGATLHYINELIEPELLQRAQISPANMASGPEEVPYSFFERLGLVPIHPSRMRPRQYYMPTTDFSQYEYDDSSPEENELRSRWLAHLYTFNTAVPAAILCVGGCMVLPLHTARRLPAIFSFGVSGVFFEAMRIYVGAFKERQDLDDFIVAKEFWYIKNEEVYELGIPRIPRGQEEYYQTRIDPVTGGPLYRGPGDFEEEQTRKREEVRRRLNF